MLHFKEPVLLVIILLLFLAVFVSPVWADQGTAATAISSAKKSILDCYGAAEEAEAADANITVLTSILNEAGLLLTQAELAYAKTDFDEALNLAVQSQSSLSNFISEANSLKETAKQQKNQDFLLNVVGSIAGTFFVIVAGFVVWLYLKKKYAIAGANNSDCTRV